MRKVYLFIDIRFVKKWKKKLIIIIANFKKNPYKAKKKKKQYVSYVFLLVPIINFFGLFSFVLKVVLHR